MGNGANDNLHYTNSFIYGIACMLFVGNFVTEHFSNHKWSYAYLVILKLLLHISFLRNVEHINSILLFKPFIMKRFL